MEVIFVSGFLAGTLFSAIVAAITTGWELAKREKRRPIPPLNGLRDFSERMRALAAAMTGVCAVEGCINEAVELDTRRGMNVCIEHCDDPHRFDTEWRKPYRPIRRGMGLSVPPPPAVRPPPPPRPLPPDTNEAQKRRVIVGAPEFNHVHQDGDWSHVCITEIEPGETKACRCGELILVRGN